MEWNLYFSLPKPQEEEPRPEQVQLVGTDFVGGHGPLGQIVRNSSRWHCKCLQVLPRRPSQKGCKSCLKAVCWPMLLLWHWKSSTESNARSQDMWNLVVQAEFTWMPCITKAFLTCLNLQFIFLSCKMMEVGGSWRFNWSNKEPAHKAAWE